MKVHTDIASIRAIERPIVTIGTFDGVHQGHRVIIDRLRSLAQEEGGESVLLTFHPHPRTVVIEGASVDLINTMEERLELLAQAGLDHVIVHPFTKEFSRISAIEYVRDFLVGHIGLYYAVVGYDHHFGRNREGGIELLHELSELYEFKVEEISAQLIQEVEVSSTKVRKALEAGQVERVKELLSYAYFLKGTVVHGEGRGRSLGFPTANILPDDSDKLIPAHGVYAVRVICEGQSHKGMLNIGVRPTFEGGDPSPSLEVHLIGFDADLYGKQLELHFEYYLRAEKKFDSAEALRQSLLKDREEVLSLLQ